MLKASRVRIVTILGLTLAAWLGAHAALAQSLGEVARREAERRKTVAGPVKVYTNDSVRPVPAPQSAPAPSSPAPVAASGETAPPGSAEAAADTGDPSAPSAKDPKEDPEYWRKRMADLRSQQDRNAFMMEAVQSRINALWTDFTARDDPAQRAVIGADRQRAVAELERMKKNQEALDKQIAALQEEARRASIPPGWIR